MALIESAYTLYESPEALGLDRQNDVADARARFLDLNAEPLNREESRANGILVSCLRQVAAPIRGSVERGTARAPWIQLASCVVEIDTDVDISRQSAQGCTCYRDTPVQQIVRSYRQQDNAAPTGTEPTGNDGPSSTAAGTDLEGRRTRTGSAIESGGAPRTDNSQSSTSENSGDRTPQVSIVSSVTARGDGVNVPDIVVRSVHRPSLSQVTALVTLVGENKVDMSERPNARARMGILQLLLQLFSAQGAYGTYWGTAMTNTRFARVAALTSRKAAIECEGVEEPVVLPIRTFLKRRDHYDLLPHDIKDDNGFQILWSIVGDAVKLLGKQRLDAPLVPLEQPRSPQWDHLRASEPENAADLDVGERPTFEASYVDNALARGSDSGSAKQRKDVSAGTGSGDADDAARDTSSAHAGGKTRKRGADDLEEGDAHNDPYETIASWTRHVRPAHPMDGMDTLDVLDDDGNGGESPKAAGCAEDFDDDLELGADANSETIGPDGVLYERALETLGVSVILVPPSTMDALAQQARVASVPPGVSHTLGPDVPTRSHTSQLEPTTGTGSSSGSGPLSVDPKLKGDSVVA